ncbi:hypothetical protein [Schlesneria paludicola]|uniref:hypothetical protein n=1 Tax=Schlesneria paludicola TaxID=360056 RepID=UPI00029B3034|nr:hypothetical protein [Schlesneria paludicola]
MNENCPKHHGRSHQKPDDDGFEQRVIVLKEGRMEGYRWFWGVLTFVTLAWYSSVTVYVSYKGLFDIRDMLKKLSSGSFDPESHGS